MVEKEKEIEHLTYEELARKNELEIALRKLAGLVKNEDTVNRFYNTQREHPRWKNKNISNIKE